MLWKKYAKVQNPEEAIKFLEELKKLDCARAKIEGDESLEQFYKERYKLIQERFPENDFEKLKYTEPKFYPCYLNEEEKEDAIKRWLMPIGEMNVEYLDSIKEYRIQEDDKWYEVITKDEKPIEFIEISDYRKLEFAICNLKWKDDTNDVFSYIAINKVQHGNQCRR